ncbi:MAG: DNA polymerase I [Coriobacteriales bacterium]|jgi:DNA polymerase-1|nr:DNA polymerase I [Coriobacteriales bacterium]
MKTIAVIDGNSLMHRAFHAVPPTMSAPDGRHTNACFGFLSMLLKMVEAFAPEGVICAFDAGVPAFRFEAIEKYKAQRPPTAPELKEQFSIIAELLDALGIPVVRVKGWEGDDILGTVSARAEALGGIHTLLVTGDKDALQLASEHTSIVNTKTGMSDVVVYDPAGVVERFGVAPSLVPDYLGLMGDASDNIPGVPGVGQKTAAKLLLEYGTMDAVLAAAEGIPGKLGENLRANVETALASRRVATIVRDVPFELDFEAAAFPSFDVAEVKRVFGAYALNAHLRKVLKLAERARGGAHGGAPGTARMVEAAQAAQAAADAEPVSRPAVPAMRLVSPVTGPAAYELLARMLASTTRIAVHVEEGGSSLFESNRRLYVASEDGIAEFGGAELRPVLAQVMEKTLTTAPVGPSVTAFSIKTVLQELVGRDSSDPALLDLAKLDSGRMVDLGLAAYLLDSSAPFESVRDLAAFYLEEGGMASDAAADGSFDVSATLALGTRLLAALEADGSMGCYRNIDMPLVGVLVRIERAGVHIDPAMLTDLSESFAVSIDRLRAQAFELAGEEFNLDSPKQLGAVLFEKLMLPPLKKTRTGYSTNATVLQELKSLNPLPGLMLEYRELAKLKSTYLDALPQLVLGDGHLHTTFHQTVAATGRLSSSDPNLQNIPVRTELGRMIRAAFVADPSVFDEGEAVFLSADYSQIELRLLAHFSADEHLVAAFLCGEDFHAQTAARVFGVPTAEVTPAMRSRAKAVNFGIVYGQQAYGLSQSLGISFSEAQDMISRYFAAYPQVQDYLKTTVAEARAEGWVATLFGRKRHVRELESSNQNQRSFGERIAMNHPMQGTAADIIKLAMIEVQRRLDAEGFRSQMVLQVHDELDFNCPLSEVDRLSSMVREAMENVVALKVPLVVEVNHAFSWAEAH